MLKAREIVDRHGYFEVNEHNAKFVDPLIKAIAKALDDARPKLPSEYEIQTEIKICNQEYGLGFEAGVRWLMERVK